MKAAKAAGAVVSFGRFSGSCSRNDWGEEQAARVIGAIAEYVDVLVGNEEDIQRGLGIPGPAVTYRSKLDPEIFFSVIERVRARFPQIKAVATTLREVHSSSRHGWTAVGWVGGKRCAAPVCEIDVIDRVGGGDGFASGFFAGLLAGNAAEDALKLGWAHGALLSTFPGDTTMATVEQVRAFAEGSSARIQR